QPLIQRIWPLLPGLAALLITTFLLVGMGTNPIDAYLAMWQGAFGSNARIYSVLAFLVPLLLAASGLLLTFKAGLWNIGIEGQIIMGAIAASWIALRVELPAGLQIPLELLAAMVGGGLWAL